jgi:hypothetical protein
MVSRDARNALNWARLATNSLLSARLSIYRSARDECDQRLRLACAPRSQVSAASVSRCWRMAVTWRSSWALESDNKACAPVVIAMAQAIPNRLRETRILRPKTMARCSYEGHCPMSGAFVGFVLAATSESIALVDCFRFGARSISSSSRFHAVYSIKLGVGSLPRAALTQDPLEQNPWICTDGFGDRDKFGHVNLSLVAFNHPYHRMRPLEPRC